MNGYDDFIERLESALADEEAREDFLEYLQGLTKEGRAEIVAEADRRGAETEVDCEGWKEMSASERPKDDAERGPEEDEARRPGGQSRDGGREVPLFLRDRSDGLKGDAQDEKDEVGE